ncbi:DUF5813 family protein [Halovenus marina]|uniref:DUF5813 family protein n=1 Tax=Halovenus marina TaxID=3396621 RepID=UPI003F548B7D
MTDSSVEAFERHDDFERRGDEFALQTIPFENAVTVHERETSTEYALTVRVPTLDGTTADDVGPTVERDWFETLQRRLEDAPKATRAAVELADFTVTKAGETVDIEYRFTWPNPTQAADIVKTLAEYVEGTYVEGVIPGYEYEPPVADLLESASQSGEGTPL